MFAYFPATFSEERSEAYDSPTSLLGEHQTSASRSCVRARKFTGLELSLDAQTTRHFLGKLHGGHRDVVFAWEFVKC
jgi:hypothetical protein